MASQAGAIKDFFIQLGFDASEVVKGFNDLEKTIGKSSNNNTRAATRSLKNLENAYKKTFNRIAYMQKKFSIDANRVGISKLSGSKEYTDYTNAFSSVEALRGGMEKGNIPKTAENLDRLRAATERLQQSQTILLTKTRQVNKQFTVTGFVAKGTTDSLKNLARSYVSVFAAMGAAGSITSTAQELTALQVTLLGVSKDAKIAAEDFEFVKQTAKGLGLNLTEATRSYAKLGTAATSAGLSTSQAREMFLATSELATAFNVSEADYEGVSRALSQIMSKGKLSTEELLQLGERVPIAFDSAAKALNVTTKELFPLIESGKIMSVDFGPQVVKEWRSFVRESGMLDKSMKTSRNAMGAFKATWLEIVDEMSKAGLEEGLHDFFRLMTTGLENLKPLFKFLGAFFGNLLKVFSTLSLITQQLFRPFIILFGKLVGITKNNKDEMNGFGKALAFVGALLLYIPAKMEQFNDWLEKSTGAAGTLAAILAAVASAILMLYEGKGKGILGWGWKLIRFLTGAALAGKGLKLVINSITRALLAMFAAKAAAEGLSGGDIDTPDRRNRRRKKGKWGRRAGFALDYAKKKGLVFAGRQIAKVPLTMSVIGAGATAAMTAYDVYDLQKSWAEYNKQHGSGDTENNVEININGVNDPEAIGKEVKKVLDRELKIGDVPY